MSLLYDLENREEAEEYGRLVESLDIAWSMIGDEVKVKGRLRLDEVLEQKITGATPLAYLLPSTRGEGLLITTLTDYLMLVHNSFVHAYRSIVKGYVVLKEKQLIINGILAMSFVFADLVATRFL